MVKKIIFSLIMLNSSVYANSELNHDPIKIVAAENFYGELAAEIGANNVTVQSIISNPDADPHLFATSPATVEHWQMHKLLFTMVQIMIHGWSRCSVIAIGKKSLSSISLT